MKDESHRFAVAVAVGTLPLLLLPNRNYGWKGIAAGLIYVHLMAVAAGVFATWE